MKRLSEQLALGWNPWIEVESSSSYMLFKEVIDNYRLFLEKMLKDGTYREDTYTSYCRNMETFNDENKVPISYVYQFDKDFCVRFLEEVYIGRDNTAFTRDNYLAFLRSFATYCLNRNHNKKYCLSTICKLEIICVLVYNKEKDLPCGFSRVPYCISVAP